MAKPVWQGLSPDWTDGDNWSTGVEPQDGDDAVIPKTSLQHIDGVDRSAVTLASLQIEEGYAQSLGAAGKPIKVNSGVLAYHGWGPAHLWGGYQVTVAAGSNTPPLSLYLGSTANMVLYVLRGVLNVQDGPAGGDIKNITVSGASHRTSLVSDFTKDVDNLYQHGGQVELNGYGCDNAHLRGGLLTYDGSDRPTYRIAGGRVIHKRIGSAAAHVYAGTLDLSEIRGEASGHNFRIYRSGTLDLQTSYPQAFTVLESYGGLVLQRGTDYEVDYK